MVVEAAGLPLIDMSEDRCARKREQGSRTPN